MYIDESAVMFDSLTVVFKPVPSVILTDLTPGPTKLLIFVHLPVQLPDVNLT